MSEGPVRMAYGCLSKAASGERSGPLIARGSMLARNCASDVADVKVSPVYPLGYCLRTVQPRWLRGNDLPEKNQRCKAFDYERVAQALSRP
jgi:hypothetical protein